MARLTTSGPSTRISSTTKSRRSSPPPRESLPSLPPFVCPRCKGALNRTHERYRCTACAADYPIVAGIPDFRLDPDPWISLVDDRNKALRLEELTRDCDFAAAVRTYWDITPTTPRPQAERFIQYVLAAEARSDEWLDWLAQVEPPAPEGSWLDLGCGTADLTAAAAKRGITIVGVDLALRWLVVAARRDAVADIRRLLVCANAEHLPFPDASFARVVSLGMLEHCVDPNPVATEARRVLGPGGLVRLRTVNRYSLLGEPHVGVWGVGFMPRRWADAYVQWRSGQRYLNHRPLSPRELLDALRRAGFRDVRVESSAMLRADAERLGPPGRVAAPAYRALRSLPIVNRAITWVSPVLDARAVST